MKIVDPELANDKNIGIMCLYIEIGFVPIEFIEAIKNVLNLYDKRYQLQIKNAIFTYFLKR